MFEVVCDSHFYNYLMHRSDVAVKVGMISKSRLLGRKLIAVKFRFEVLNNSHFYNYSIYRNVVVATVTVGVMSKSKIIGRKSYSW